MSVEQYLPRPGSSNPYTKVSNAVVQKNYELNREEEEKNYQGELDQVSRALYGKMKKAGKTPDQVTNQELDSWLAHSDIADVATKTKSPGIMDRLGALAKGQDQPDDERVLGFGKPKDRDAIFDNLQSLYETDLGNEEKEKPFKAEVGMAVAMEMSKGTSFEDAQKIVGEKKGLTPEWFDDNLEDMGNAQQVWSSNMDTYLKSSILELEQSAQEGTWADRYKQITDPNSPFGPAMARRLSKSISSYLDEDDVQWLADKAHTDGEKIKTVTEAEHVVDHEKWDYYSYTDAKGQKYWRNKNKANEIVGGVKSKQAGEDEMGMPMMRDYVYVRNPYTGLLKQKPVSDPYVQGKASDRMNIKKLATDLKQINPELFKSPEGAVIMEALGSNPRLRRASHKYATGIATQILNATAKAKPGHRMRTINNILDNFDRTGLLDLVRPKNAGADDPANPNPEGVNTDKDGEGGSGGAVLPAEMHNNKRGWLAKGLDFYGDKIGTSYNNVAKDFNDRAVKLTKLIKGKDATLGERIKIGGLSVFQLAGAGFNMFGEAVSIVMPDWIEEGVGNVAMAAMETQWGEATMGKIGEGQEAFHRYVDEVRAESGEAAAAQVELLADSLLQVGNLAMTATGLKTATTVGKFANGVRRRRKTKLDYKKEVKVKKKQANIDAEKAKIEAETAAIKAKIDNPTSLKEKLGTVKEAGGKVKEKVGSVLSRKKKTKTPVEEPAPVQTTANKSSSIPAQRKRKPNTKGTRTNWLGQNKKKKPIKRNPSTSADDAALKAAQEAEKKGFNTPDTDSKVAKLSAKELDRPTFQNPDNPRKQPVLGSLNKKKKNTRTSKEKNAANVEKNTTLTKAQRKTRTEYRNKKKELAELQKTKTPTSEQVSKMQLLKRQMDAKKFDKYRFDHD